jgi:hypothetical protein
MLPFPTVVKLEELQQLRLQQLREEDDDSCDSLACLEAQPALVRQCVAALCRVGRSAGWSPEKLWSAVGLCLRLHRVSHEQRDGGGLLAYAECRRAMLVMLVSLSSHCPPFSQPLLSASDCSLIIRCLDSEYFPFLHLSQLQAVSMRRLTVSQQTADDSSSELQLSMTAMPADESELDQQQQQQPSADNAPSALLQSACAALQLGFDAEMQKLRTANAV